MQTSTKVHNLYEEWSWVDDGSVRAPRAVVVDRDL